MKSSGVGSQNDAISNDADVHQRPLWRPAVDQALADENAAGDVYWFLTDNQGTIRDVAQYDAGQDETTIANHIVFDSFGREVSQTDDTLDVLDLGYTGRWLDRATGLQWNLHRWYNAVFAVACAASVRATPSLQQHTRRSEETLIAPGT